jgi:hypothetical protein
LADDSLVLVEQAVARKVLLGLRKSLTIEGQLRRPVEGVNDALARLRDACEGCIVLTKPHPDEPRVVVTIVDWARIRRVARAR